MNPAPDLATLVCRIILLEADNTRLAAEHEQDQRTISVLRTNIAQAITDLRQERETVRSLTRRLRNAS